VLAGALSLAVVGVTYWRLFYGVDLTDESFYVALPYRFVLGARPFVDETTVSQQAALLVYPFVRAYAALAGVDGLVLFVRHLQLALSLLVAGAAFVSLRRLVRSDAAAVALALPAVAFVPFDVHSLSYNTLGCGLFTAGSLLAFAAAPGRGGRRRLLVAGACLGLAVFAYPPLVAAGAACLAARLLASRRAGDLAAFGLPLVLLPLAGMTALVATSGLHAVARGYRNSTGNLGHGGGLGKLWDVVDHQATTFHYWYVLLPVLALAAAAWRLRPALAASVLSLLPLVLWPVSLSRAFPPTTFSASVEFAAHDGLLALPLFAFVRRRPEAQRLLVAVWAPALVAGAATGYASSNGGVNAGVGLFPATFVTTVFLVWAVEDALRRAGRARPAPALPALAPALVVPAILLVLGTAVYRDGPLSRLPTAVSGGAFAGIRTSTNKALYLDQLEHDLAGVGHSCRIAFFKDFPAGYLLTAARPDTNAAWVATVRSDRTEAYQDDLVRYWQRHGFPDVAVVVRLIPYESRRSARVERYLPGTPLADLLASPAYRLIARRYNYALYERRSSTCGVVPPARSGT